MIQIQFKIRIKAVAFRHFEQLNVIGVPRFIEVDHSVLIGLERSAGGIRTKVEYHTWKRYIVLIDDAQAVALGRSQRLLIGIIGFPGDVIAPGAHLLGQRLELFFARNQIDGTLENAIDIYTTLLEVGKPYGIQRLDRHACWNTHTEGGFPQFIIHFPYAWETDPGFIKWMQDTNCPMDDYAISLQKRGGSMGDAIEPRFCNPIELGWQKAVPLKRDYRGRDALEKIVNGPHREMVTLEWNVDDIMDIYRSEYEPGEPYATLEGPEDYQDTGAFPGASSHTGPVRFLCDARTGSAAGRRILCDQRSAHRQAEAQAALAGHLVRELLCADHTDADRHGSAAAGIDSLSLPELQGKRLGPVFAAFVFIYGCGYLMAWGISEANRKLSWLWFKDIARGKGSAAHEEV